MIALASVQGYHGYLLFAWMYGIFLGGFQFSIKIYTLERVRVRQFPRGWGFVQGAKAVPVLLGIPITCYINEASSNPKAGLYFAVATCFAGAAILFLMDSFRSSASMLPSNVGSQHFLYGGGSRGELCKTDTNLTFELMGGADPGGRIFPESASSDGVGGGGGAMLMRGRNGRRLSDSQSFNNNNREASLIRKDSFVAKVQKQEI